MPSKRPEDLDGVTYKLRWRGEVEDETYYITITNIEVDGKLRPFEIFFNSQNVNHYPWMVALARMISAVFQRGENVSFVANELQEVFDPRGGQTIGTVHYHSLLDMIGKVVERHMVDIGYIKAPGPIISGIIKEAEDEAVAEEFDLTARQREDVSIYLQESPIPQSEPSPKPDHELIPTSAEAIGRATISIDKVNPPKDDDDDFDVRGL